MRDFDTLIVRALELGLRDPGDPRWQDARRKLFEPPTDCSAFIEWATHHPKWSHNVADAADRVCAKPLEAAVFVLADIVAELMDDAAADGLAAHATAIREDLV